MISKEFPEELELLIKQEYPSSVHTQYNLVHKCNLGNSHFGNSDC